MKKILIIDDSALMRRIFSDIINQTGEYKVSHVAKNGLEGLQILQDFTDIDVCLCDINMPKMNGLELLKEVKQNNIDVPFVVVSSTKDVNETFMALELGAVEFVEKPDRVRGEHMERFADKLTRAIKTAVISKRHGSLGSDVKHNNSHSSVETIRSNKSSSMNDESCKEDNLKEHLSNDNVNRTSLHANRKRKLVALVCSTGGPRALQCVIPNLPSNLAAPVLVVQHMPAGFTNNLAKRLDGLSKISVKEAEDGELLKNGVVYIAKGGMHLSVVENNNNARIAFDDRPPIVGLKPCGNIMYQSLVNTGFDEITCVVLTGMGADGTKGIKELSTHCSIHVIAQDEDSSTVYGMPKAIYESGLTNVVCDIHHIADEIVKKVGVL